VFVVAQWFGADRNHVEAMGTILVAEGSPTQAVQVRGLLKAANFQVHVVHNGFDPATLPDPTDSANLEKPSGRGLLLIHAFMDEVSFNATGNQIRMVKRLEA
jgi:anti-sigma regulatory factor (Ser/Thr protein kinase)